MITEKQVDDIFGNVINLYDLHTIVCGEIKQAISKHKDNLVEADVTVSVENIVWSIE